MKLVHLVGFITKKSDEFSCGISSSERRIRIHGVVRYAVRDLTKALFALKLSYGSTLYL